jgi:hypothetical protein
MRPRRTLATCLVLAGVLVASGRPADRSPWAAAAAAAPVHFGASFDAGARLGHSTALHFSLGVSVKQMAPVTEVRLLTPGGLELSTSRLGVASCRRPAREIVRVMGPVQHERCPRNSLMGVGSATAGLLLSQERTIFGAAIIELHAGATVDDKPGLLVTADAYNPVRLQLTYQGYLYVPPDPFGLGLAIKIPAIPSPPLGAPIAMSTFALVVGGSSIVYRHTVRGRSVWYRPGGIPLPRSCPPGGFRFRAILRFADGSRRAVDRAVPCPLTR